LDFCCSSIPVTTTPTITAKAMLAPSYHPFLIPYTVGCKEQFIDQKQDEKTLI
jgi:hypothetical protein